MFSRHTPAPMIQGSHPRGPGAHQYLASDVSGVSWDELSGIPAPPGTSLGAMAAQGMFSEVANALALAQVGVFTPWASRTGDMAWEEIRNPDTNVIAFSLTDAQINTAEQVTFGAPLPFVVVMTDKPLTSDQVAAMWEGTAYHPYETQAVYRQDDAKPIPNIYFMHWGERIDIAELPKAPLAIAPRARAVGGVLIFGAQIPVQGSTTRQPPAVTSFDDAMSLQFGQVAPSMPTRVPSLPLTMPTTPVPGPAPMAPPALGPGGAMVTAPAATKMNLGLPIAVGLGAAALGFVIWRNTR
jgi:hypothetical protein